jgi:hypothetical protein
VVHPSVNGSAPPASSRLIYEAVSSLRTGIVPDGIKEMRAQTKFPCSVTSQVPDQRQRSKLKNEGCENVLPGQVYHIYQGRVYRAMVERQSVGEN